MTDKTINQLKQSVHDLEETIEKMFKIISDEFGIYIESVEVEGGPVVWDQQGERVRQSNYKVKINTNL